MRASACLGQVPACVLLSLQTRSALPRCHPAERLPDAGGTKTFQARLWLLCLSVLESTTQQTARCLPWTMLVSEAHVPGCRSQDTLRTLALCQVPHEQSGAPTPRPSQQGPRREIRLEAGPWLTWVTGDEAPSRGSGPRSNPGIRVRGEAASEGHAS